MRKPPLPPPILSAPLQAESTPTMAWKLHYDVYNSTRKWYVSNSSGHVWYDNIAVLCLRSAALSSLSKMEEIRLELYSVQTKKALPKIFIFPSQWRCTYACERMINRNRDRVIVCYGSYADLKGHSTAEICCHFDTNTCTQVLCIANIKTTCTSVGCHVSHVTVSSNTNLTSKVRGTLQEIWLIYKTLCTKIDGPLPHAVLSHIIWCKWLWLNLIEYRNEWCLYNGIIESILGTQTALINSLVLSLVWAKGWSTRGEANKRRGWSRAGGQPGECLCKHKH